MTIISRLKLILTSKLILAAISLITGYLLGFFKFPFKLVELLKGMEIIPHFDLSFIGEYLNALNLNTDFLGDVMAIEAVIVALAIPMSLSLASSFKDYDKDISFFFIKEPIYRCQYILLIGSIIFCLIVKLLNITNTYLLLCILIWSIINLIVFSFFISLVHRYIVDTDKVILSRLSKYAGKIFKK